MVSTQPHSVVLTQPTFCGDLMSAFSMGMIYIPWIFVGAHCLKPRAVVDGVWQINNGIQESLGWRTLAGEEKEGGEIGDFRGVYSLECLMISARASEWECS
jgi:hypothetical protein